MLFTHRSKVGNEKWDRSFNTRESYDSVEYTYIDPDTNIKETIKIPSIGGAKPNKIDGIGVRNYKQAFWAANRARQKDKLRRISVEFEATEEGIYAKRGEMIEVVKGSRVGTYDGYIVAQNGLQLTLSQEVEFVDGDNHSLVLKRRDGTAESVSVEKTTINKRTVNMLSLPSETIYTGNSALKTEFSFGNDSRHFAQMIIPASVEPNDNRTVKITGYNYDSGYYLYDNVPVFNGFEFDRNEFDNQEFA
ncbi:MAG: host specificity factor TipJ family phage tail protein, partial [Shewanella sp.]